MSIHDDFSVNKNGDIRYNGEDGTYTVVELHRYLQSLVYQPIGGGLLDISNPNPSWLVTQNIVRLLGNYNIDDYTSNFLYDGTIIQGEDVAEEVYNGLIILGVVNTPETKIGIIQNNKLYRLIYCGYNKNSSDNVLARCLIKSKTNGKLIDDGKFIIRARHAGDTFDEFNLIADHVGTVAAAIYTTKDLYYSDSLEDKEEEIEFITLDDVLI